MCTSVGYGEVTKLLNDSGGSRSVFVCFGICGAVEL